MHSVPSKKEVSDSGEHERHSVDAPPEQVAQLESHASHVDVE